MDITIDQVRALQAVAEAGSFAKASEVLGKNHSAVIYSIKSLEAQTNLKLLDRSQYRSTLTDAGRLVLESCRKLLEAEKNLQHLCHTLNAGWESYLRIVYDFSFPTETLLKAVSQLADRKIPTRVQLIAGSGTQLFELKKQKHAHLLISLVPPQNHFESIALSPYHLVLVISSTHPVFSLQKKQSLTMREVSALSFWMTEGDRQNAQLSTASLKLEPTVQVPNYETLISAIVAKQGFGWVPEHLVATELRKKSLRLLPWSGSSTLTLHPRLYYKSAESLGKAEALFVEKFSRLQHPSTVPQEFEVFQ